jgi:L-lactate permease
MTEHLLSVFGAIILVGLLAGVSGVVAWEVIIPWLDDLMSEIVGILAVLTFVARVASFVSDRREQSRANRSLIESDTEDDP